MPGTDFLLTHHVTHTARRFSASIKCICIVEFCLSFYFSYHIQFSTLFCRIMSDYVRFCRKLCILHTIYIYFVHCIQYIFPLYIAYIIISLLKSIQYFFLYLLDKVHYLCFTNFISNILIPLKSQVKTLKK